MQDLTTRYLGLNLRTPLVPSASPLSRDMENIRQMEQAGAAAVVFHSLFEEQILHRGSNAGPELEVRPEAYLEQIAEAKDRVAIPIIASLNCTTLDAWVEFAQRIEQTGADALELNIYRIPTDPDKEGATIERECVETVKAVRAAVGIPLAVKLSPYFSNFANMAHRLDAAGADALVLFNRFYQPDIDLGKMTVAPHLMLSTPTAMRLPLCWVGILFEKVRANLAATSGIHQSSDVIKMLLAGADVTMVCSALLRHGIEYIERLEKELRVWMDQNGHASLSEFRGSLSQKNCADPGAFERDQYIHALATYEPLFLMRR